MVQVVLTQQQIITYQTLILAINYLQKIKQQQEILKQLIFFTNKIIFIMTYLQC